MPRPVQSSRSHKIQTIIAAMMVLLVLPLTGAAEETLLLRQPFEPDQFDEVILGCVNVHAVEVNPGRVSARTRRRPGRW